MKMMTLTLADGSVLIGRPNYVTEHGAEIETITGEFVWVDRDQIHGSPDIADVTTGLAA